jgi:RNA polymerase sigma factor (sigma-70 family)
MSWRVLALTKFMDESDAGRGVSLSGPVATAHEKIMQTRVFSTVLQHLRNTMHGQHDAEWTDAQLLGRFIMARDPVAFATLVRRHGPMVLGVCQRITGDRHDAEDAFQATFLILVRKAAAIAVRDLLGPWLYGVACNTARKARAIAGRRRVRERSMADLPEHARGAPDPGRAEELALLDQELSRLSEPHREVIVLCDLQGLTRKEAARQLGCPEGSVSSRLARGRTLLARRLAQRGVAPAAAAGVIAMAAEASAAELSPRLAAATLHAAAAMATDAAAHVVSETVIALMEDVMKTMFLGQLKQMVLSVLVLAIGVAAIGLTCYGLHAQDQAAAPGAAPVQGHKAAGAKAGLKDTQHAAARKAFDSIWDAYQTGYHDEETVYRWSVRLLEAQKACAADAAGRLTAAKAHLARMQKLEKLAPERIVIVPVERFGLEGKLGLGIGVDKKGQRMGITGELGPRPAHAAETTAFFRAEAEVWLAEAEAESLKKAR